MTVCVFISGLCFLHQALITTVIVKGEIQHTQQSSQSHNPKFYFENETLSTAELLNSVIKKEAPRFGQTENDAAFVQNVLQKIQSAEADKHRIAYNLTSLSGSNKTVRFPEESDHLYEGDIVLWPEQASEILNSISHKNSTRHKRKFVTSRYRRWNPTRPILYTFDETHTFREREKVKSALRVWERSTCLHFEFVEHHLRMFSKNIIIFTTADGCASNVGKNPLEEPQYVSLAKECLQEGVMTHEVAHALGFWHEQSRPDRDDYVTVHWREVELGLEGQFTKEVPSNVDEAHIAYDYGSVMHYRSTAYSRTDRSTTITTNIQGYQHTIGQRTALSFADVKLMNKIYCSGTCSLQLPCYHNGYTDPANCSKCRCPDGFAGKLCNRVMRSSSLFSTGRKPCGGLMNATEDYQIISTPNYPGFAPSQQHCSWLIKAPFAAHVVLEFEDPYNISCEDPQSFCTDYVEINNSSNYDITGMRFCCNERKPDPIYSAGSEMLVLFRTFQNRGFFAAKVKHVKSSGDWQSWQPWSQCTASCGGCGTQIRYRGCQQEVCQGHFVESRACNQHACTKCRKKVVMIGRKVKMDSACYGYEKCCHGYRPQGSACIPED